MAFFIVRSDFIPVFLPIRVADYQVSELRHKIQQPCPDMQMKNMLSYQGKGRGPSRTEVLLVLLICWRMKLWKFSKENNNN